MDVVDGPLNPGHSTPRLVYILSYRDGSLYTGFTNDLPKRLKAHAAGKVQVHKEQASRPAGPH
jgi:predicted GIY-YIG superfamily endonuclease